MSDTDKMFVGEDPGVENIEKLVKPPIGKLTRIIAVTVVGVVIFQIAMMILLNMGGYDAFTTPMILEEDFTYDGDAYHYSDALFNITSYDYLDDLTLKAINKLYGDYDEILTRLDHKEMPRIDLIFYGDRDAYMKTGVTRSDYVAYYHQGVIRVLNPDAEGAAEDLEYASMFSAWWYEHILLNHEFIHAVQEDKYHDFPNDRWITEGVANYVSYDIIGLDRLNVKDDYQGKTIEIHTLDEMNDGYEYTYGFTMIDYLVQTYGEGIVNGLIEEPLLRDEVQLLKLTGEDTEGIFDGWMAFMVKEYGMLVP